MTIPDEITIIANQLANEGKTPSVALVKAKLTQIVPLPKIIGVLKVWQHDPKFIKLPSTNNLKDKETVREKVADNKTIELALDPIKKELSEIKELLNQLLDSNKNS